MEVRISIGERKLMLLLAVIIAVSTVGLVMGYGGSNPQVVGHSWDEMSCSNCITNANLADNSVTGSKIADNSVTGAKIGCDNILCKNSVNGNIGIGTANPEAKLHVVGDTQINGVIRGATYGFGGMYAIEDYGACRSANPFTGSCSCPSGFGDMSTGSAVLDGYSRWLYIHICYK